MLRKILLCCIILSPAVALSDNHSYDLTDEKVDRYLQVMPDTSKVLKALEKRLRPDKELNEKVQAAVSQGKMHRTILEVAADSPELGELKSVVENAGYESLDAWAYTSDRITSVFMVGEFLNAFAALSFADIGFKEGDNVFDFVTDQSRPAEARSKLLQQLEDDCEKSCVVADDLEVVAPRMKEVVEAFKALQ